VRWLRLLAGTALMVWKDMCLGLRVSGHLVLQSEMYKLLVECRAHSFLEASLMFYSRCLPSIS
jgi:hypothetical protein